MKIIEDLQRLALIALGLVALYLVLSSKNSEPIIKDAFSGSTAFVKTLQARA